MEEFEPTQSLDLSTMQEYYEVTALRIIVRIDLSLSTTIPVITQTAAMMRPHSIDMIWLSCPMGDMRGTSVWMYLCVVIFTFYQYILLSGALNKYFYKKKISFGGEICRSYNQFV